MQALFTSKNGKVGVTGWVQDVSRQNRTYLPFEEARNYVRKLCLKNFKEWSTYCKSGKKPENILMAANDIYKK